MCGILGISPPIALPVFKQALDLLTHRGPDGEGIWKDDTMMFGHRRLSILDLTDNGSQPMTRGHLTIVYNGEIYNFLEIKKELVSLGHRFSSESDTEVILFSYLQWGPDCLLKFNGMWSFVIWDDNKKKLFLSRDRFGKKPLFYSLDNERFIFASEMKAVFPFLRSVRPSVKFEWCKNHIFDYESTEHCLIEGIKRFPAAHYGYYSPGDKEISITRYWNTLDHLPEHPKSYDEQVEQFRELFIDACRIRMRSDVPVGTTLSGGLDSSATVCAMAHIGRSEMGNRLSKDWQHALTAVFPGTFLDESCYAKKVADHLGIKVDFFNVDPVKGLDNLNSYLFHLEELYITSPVPAMQIYEKSRENNIVVSIDGHGADDMLAGYGIDVYHMFMDAGLSIKKIRNILETYKGISTIPSNQLEKEDHSLLSYFKYLYKHQGTIGTLSHLFSTFTGKKAVNGSINGHSGYFNKYLYKLFHQTTLPTILRNIDRVSMANGVEVRMPFLDHRLVSYCFSLPAESKVRNGFTKTLIRDAFGKLMPAEVVNRKSKIGLNSPIVDWMKGPWKQFLTDEINSREFKECDLIDAPATKRKIEHVIHEKAYFTEGETAWQLLVPYLWEKALIKNKSYQYA